MPEAEISTAEEGGRGHQRSALGSWLLAEGWPTDVTLKPRAPQETKAIAVRESALIRRARDVPLHGCRANARQSSLHNVMLADWGHGACLQALDPFLIRDH